MPRAMTPDELCIAYREELRRLYGDEIADKSRIDYGHGWYYVSKAKRYSDGSIGVWSVANAYHKKQMLKMLEVLRARDPKQTERR
jgi:hypothetical protein